MGILFTILMGILFTITIGILFTIVLGIQFTISSAPLSGLMPTTSLNCRLESRGMVITVAIFFTSFFMDFGSSKTKLLYEHIIILPYISQY